VKASILLQAGDLAVEECDGMLSCGRPLNESQEGSLAGGSLSGWLVRNVPKCIPRGIPLALKHEKGRTQIRLVR
jgi:hypothetical protein